MDTDKKTVPIKVKIVAGVIGICGIMEIINTVLYSFSYGIEIDKVILNIFLVAGIIAISWGLLRLQRLAWWASIFVISSFIIRGFFAPIFMYFFIMRPLGFSNPRTIGIIFISFLGIVLFLTLILLFSQSVRENFRKSTN